MPADTSKACPVCGKPAQPATRPFCSVRCRNVDLGRWMGGTYAIPGPLAGEEDDDAER